MAQGEGDRTNNDAADAGTGGGGVFEEGGAGAPASGSEAAGNDPAGMESSGVGDPRQQQEGGAEGVHGGGGHEGGGRGERAGDWNPGEHSGGGGELY
jgi:hypothetical protein